MNTAILSPHGGSVGIGFAVPSNMIRQVSEQIEKTGRVTRGFLGVESQSMTATTAKALGVSEHAGALLAGVNPNGPAAGAGLKAGDIIQSVNGQTISGPRDLAVTIAGLAPGEEARLGVLRNGTTHEMNVKIGEMPNDRIAAADDTAQPQRMQVGVALAPLSPDMRQQLDLPEDVKGAVIQQVRPGSPAEMAGLQPGDVIVGVGTRTVTSPADAVKEMRQALAQKDGALALRILRHGSPAFVGVPMDQSDQKAG